ncbi:MAG: hypothetical protein RLZZ324_1045 [Candidatus Parcubacteria bacterium]|jgi:hypothetical protein
MRHRSFTHLMLTFLAFAVLAGCSNTTATTYVRQFRGTYIGISESAASPIGFGEMELTVSADTIRTRLATGKGVQYDQMELSKLAPMSDEEIAWLYKGARDAAPKGLKPKGAALDAGLRYLFFQHSAGTKPDVVIVDSSNPNAACFFYSTKHDAETRFARMMQETGLKAENVPRLRTDGRSAAAYDADW